MNFTNAGVNRGVSFSGRTLETLQKGFTTTLSFSEMLRFMYRGEKIELTDDVQADMKRIRKHYKEKGIQGKHPELFTTGSDIE